MEKANPELREKIMSSGKKQWELANRLGVSEGTLTRWLRTELPEAKKKEILSALEDIKRNGQ